MLTFVFIQSGHLNSKSVLYYFCIMKHKGIILAGGAGTRLYPASLPISKILLPVYDKPMIYYPLSVLISAGIDEILIITNKRDEENFKYTLGDGSKFGVKIQYKIQQIPKGVAESLLIAEDFLQNHPLVLILGDNIFYGGNFNKILKKAITDNKYATIFGCYSKTPQKFGVIELDEYGNVISIEEKPKKPKSNYAVSGLYIYNNDAVRLAKQLVPSVRGELEITDLNNLYLNLFELKAVLFEKDIFWQDTGTFDSMLEAALFIKNEECKTGQKIGCIEEAAIKTGFISQEKCFENISIYPKNQYYDYVYQFEGDKKYV